MGFYSDKWLSIVVFYAEWEWIVEWGVRRPSAHIRWHSGAQIANLCEGFEQTDNCQDCVKPGALLSTILTPCRQCEAFQFDWITFRNQHFTNHEGKKQDIWSLAWGHKNLSLLELWVSICMTDEAAGMIYTIPGRLHHSSASKTITNRWVKGSVRPYLLQPMIHRSAQTLDVPHLMGHLAAHSFILCFIHCSTLQSCMKQSNLEIAVTPTYTSGFLEHGESAEHNHR